MGVSLLFQEKESNSGLALLRLYLSNESSRDLIVQYTLSAKGEGLLHESFSLKKNELYALGDIEKDRINDRPSFHIELRALTTEGGGDIHEKTTKIRTKLFMRSPTIHHKISSPVYIMHLFDKISYEKKQDKKIKDLVDHSMDGLTMDEETYKNIEVYDPLELAHFNNVVDLHIHSLHSNPNTLRKSEIMNLQLSVFQEELEKAIQLDIERVFFVHGIGTGRLKNEITTYLFNHPQVVSFKNEYHPKFGGGATEVILKE